MELTSSHKDLPAIDVTGNDNPAVFLIQCAARLKDGLKKGKLAALAQTKLTPQGILDIPCLVQIGKDEFAVYFYQKADTKASKHFTAARDALKKAGVASFYYAPKPLKTAKGGKPFRTFEAADLSPGEIKKGTYAMWWATPNEKSFGKAQASKNLRRAYKALDGIEEYVFARMAWELKLIDQEAARVALPDTFDIAVKGPENEPFILNVSKEKGIRFLFNTKKTTPEYRDNFWKTFADYAEEWKKGAKKEKLPTKKQEPRPADWYLAVEQRAKEHGKGITFIGGKIVGK